MGIARSPSYGRWMRVGPPRHRRLLGRAGPGLALTLLLGALVAPQDAGQPPLAGARSAGSEDPITVDTTEAEARAATQAIVQLAPGVDPATVLRDLGIDESAIVHRYRDGGFALVADDDLRARLAAHEGVAGVADDGVVVVLEEVPSNVARIRAPEAHAAGFDGGPDHGEVVRVAIVDTGIDLDHPDLAPNLDVPLGKDCTRTGSTDDDHGHGTHVGGTVAAVADGSGVLGVAPAARLVPVKVLPAGGSGLRSDVICGLEHVLALATDADPANDVRVVNMSLGGSGSSPATCDGDLYRSVICKLTEAGVTVVVSAGNDSADAKYKVPAAFPEAITVSAIDDADDRMASFSNFGAGVDVTAPGVSVNSARMGGGLTRKSGTSMSSPAVAGAVAVLLAAGDPGTPAEISALLRATGECPDGTRAGDDETCAGQGTWAGDRDSIVEPLVDVAEPALLVGAEVRFAAPRRNAVVHGIVPITVRTGEGPGDAAVRVRVDAGPWQDAAPVAGSGQHSLAWDSTSGGDGRVAIEAEVARGGEVTVLATEVLVRNGPYPTIAAPVGGATARGSVPVSVAVSHPTEPPESLAVVLHAPKGDETVPVALTWDPATTRFTGTWDSRWVLDGPEVLRVTASDAQQRANDATVTVTVDNSPTVTVTAPPAGYVGGTVPLAVTAVSDVHPPGSLQLTWRAGALSGSLERAGGSTFTGSWDTIAMAEGYASLEVTAIDPDGRTTTVRRGVTVRNAPTVRLDTTTASGTVALRATATSALHPPETLAVTFTLTGVGTLSMAWDGTGFVTPPIDTRVWADGAQYPVLTAVDPDGRAASSYPSLQIRNGPTLTFLEPAATTVGGSVVVAVRVTDPDDPPATLTPTLLVDGTGTAVPLVYDASLDRHQVTIDTTGIPDGSHHLAVRVTDPAGRSASSTRSITVRNAFTASWSSPAEGAKMTASADVRVRVTSYADPPASVQGTLAVDGGPPVALTYDAASGHHRATLRTHDWPDGPHRLDVLLTDPRGRAVSLARAVEFANRPSITVVAPESGARIHGSGNVSVIATDTGYSGFNVTLSAPGMGPVAMTYDWTSGRFTAPAFDSNVLPDGPVILTFTITDGEGLSASATRDVIVANAPTLEIVQTWGSTVDGVVPLSFRALGPDGTEGSVDLSWWVEGAGNGYPQPNLATEAIGDWSSVLDVTHTAEGRYTLRAEARSRSGRITTVTRAFEVRHRPTFGVGFLNPLAGLSMKGIHQVVVHAWGGQLAGDHTAPASAWFRVDGGPWQPMGRRDSSSEFEARWDTRSLAAGTHRVEVTATDYRGGASTRGIDVVVVRPTQALAVEVPVALASQALDGIVTVAATVTGGALEWDINSPLSAWYRVDAGAWLPMRGLYGQVSAPLDTADLRPGSHRIEVAATDWVGGVATGSLDVVVKARPPISVAVLAPTEGASGRAPIGLVVRATSATVAPKGLSVFARAGSGAWVALTLADGHFFGRVPVSSAVPSGTSVTLEVVAIDYRGGIATATVGHRVLR